MLRHLRVALAALGATGCIALIQPIDVGDHCTISGSTECATCIRTKCQAPIDTCCGTKGCGLEYTGGLVGGLGAGLTSNVLGVVDQCGGGDRGACASGLADARSGTEEEAVRACITSSCNAECVAGATGIGSIGPSATWTCQFSRESERSCGKCIYAQCASALDDCCGDSACASDSSLQKLVAACAVAEDPALCVYRFVNRETSGHAGVVGKCIYDSCAKDCFGDGRPHESCDLYGSGAYCACSDAEKSSGPVCDTASGATCVLDKTGCTCGHYACTDGDDGCSCNLHAASGDTPGTCSLSGAQGSCCIVLDGSGPRCKCSTLSSSCLSELGEYSVKSCNAEDFVSALRDAKGIVDSCSH